MVYGYIRNGYGVALSVETIAVVGSGVMLSIIACGVGRGGVGATVWQATRPIRINRPMHCFMNQFYQRKVGESFQTAL
jgi:hypothetical protein